MTSVILLQLIFCLLKTEFSNREPSMSCVMQHGGCQGHMVKNLSFKAKF